ncbi:hypothetical protein ColTof4_06316 [Colletotrichum tofieldiae]|nr:hypothetical protein ColTof3_01499 [Colletotrichum tofieldiae]GKT73893.1 hypothetical protein ColTof4_06316 [Colletotrichum tofieldiae]
MAAIDPSMLGCQSYSEDARVWPEDTWWMSPTHRTTVDGGAGRVSALAVEVDAVARAASDGKGIPREQQEDAP